MLSNPSVSPKRERIARHADPFCLFKCILNRDHHGIRVCGDGSSEGVIVGEGESYDEALNDVKSAIRFHIETFGPDSVGTDSVLEAFVAEADLAAR